MVLAYLAAPVALVMWMRGRARIIWGVVGFTSTITAAILLLRVNTIQHWLDGVPGGAMIWAILLATSILGATTTWSRAILHAALVDGSSIPPALRKPVFAVGLGALIPGAGLVLARQGRRGAIAWWVTGPLLLGTVLLLNWEWLWTRAQSELASGLSSNGIEILLMSAGGVVALAIIMWVVQALDGVRMISSGRSLAVTDATTTALVISLLAFVATFHPVRVAQTLHDGAELMATHGMVLAPLALAETASRLDPATAAYIASAADHLETLGQIEKSDAYRGLLRRRLFEYQQYTFGVEIAKPKVVVSDIGWQRPLDQTDHRPVY